MARRRTAPASKQPARPAIPKHKVRSTVPPPAPVETMTLYFHPQRGAVISAKPINLMEMTYRGGSIGDWREVMKLRMMRDERGMETPVPGQKLPKGFLWGAPARQSFGMGGPELVFGPLSKVCRDCKEPFIFPAHAQKHLIEEVGLFIDVTAVRCLACGQRKGQIESARRAHAEALSTLEVYQAAASYLAAARAALALLEAGGRTRVDRAIGQARRARQLGARAAEKVEERLKALRTEAQATQAVKAAKAAKK